MLHESSLHNSLNEFHIMNPLIKSHFENKNFDIRRQNPGYSRFMDQKVTPDVLSFVADCILNLKNAISFTVKDIWESDYFEKNTKAIFGKPKPSNQTASSEYNKFIGQPLKALAYAKVLIEEKDGRRNRYKISNENLLRYISQNERGALDFLYEYIMKVLSDSGFIIRLEYYSETPSPEHFSDLKSHFRRFMLGHTNIQGETEINRIFPKMLNPFAVRRGLPGSEGGRMTKDCFAYSDLMYNRTNFRDWNKPKGKSRQEASMSMEEKEEQRKAFEKYATPKAVQLIKQKYTDSEVKDQWAKGEATQVHHIFPRSQYPEFAAYVENLIKLTPEQHYNHAHPNANMHQANKNYQLQCLLAKCDSIESSINSGEFIYSKASFVYLLNECLGLDINQENSFDDIREKLRALQTTV